MRVKTFVGKDRQIRQATVRKRPKTAGPARCHNCGDELGGEWCRKCSITLQHYRDVDAVKNPYRRAVVGLSLYYASDTQRFNHGLARGQE